MTNKYISTLSAVGRNDIHTVGGKGANLGELADKGFPVPSGFVVSAEACSIFFESLRLQKILHSLKKTDPKELAQACAVLRNTITNASFPGELAESILAAHNRLLENRGDETVCAVRSSATTEDLSEASFAGQHATYYYVERANLLRMIQYCWASLWSKEAVSYRKSCGIEHSAAMAVVVQEMVRSDISGITFTSDPITDADEIVIEASWGMGAAIVDGRVTPDRYILDHDTLEVREQRIAEKNVMVPNRLRPETSSRLMEVPPGLQQQATLSPELLQTVAAWALKAEQHFGSPQNVEWAVSAGRFYILQSRPISPVGRKSIPSEPEGQYVLFRSGADSSARAPFTPLTADLISRAASPLLRSIHSHCYLNLKYIRPLFPFQLSDNELTELFSDFSDFTPEKLPSLEKFSLRKLPLSIFFCLYGCFLFCVFRARSGSRIIPKHLSAGYNKLRRKITRSLTDDTVNSLLRRTFVPKIFDPAGSLPFWMNISPVRYLLNRLPLGILIKYWLPELQAEARSLFHVRRHSIYSKSMHSAIQQLALKAGQFSSIREQFLNRPSDYVLKGLKKNPNARPFFRLFEQFIEQYGYRAAKDLELQSVRWEENPNLVIRLIRDQLLAPTKKHKKLSPVQQERLTEKIKRHLEQYPFERPCRPRWHLLLLLHKISDLFLKLADDSRSYHLMTMSVARKKLLLLEEQFLCQGILKCKGDIFFLHLAEISDIEQGLLAWPDLEERIHQRRHDFIRATRKTPPKTVGVELQENSRRASNSLKKPGLIIPGQTASPGSYTGRARVIMEPQQHSELLPGEILVAPYTDPGWTPLFFTAGGAVVEVGSYLSHAGTAAREYTLPCIVDAADCTKRIQTGDLLWINGEKGEVQILESKKLSDEKTGRDEKAPAQNPSP